MSFVLPAATTDQPVVTGGALERRRRLAEALLAKGMDTSPIQSPWQGAARLAQAMLGAYDEYQIGKDERRAKDSLKADEAGYLGLGAPSTQPAPQAMTEQPAAQAPTVAAMQGQPESAAVGDVPRTVYGRLLAGGLTPAAAAGLLGNLKMESGFRTDARNPGDGRDGSDSIGLAQWNSTRAAALKQFAGQRQADWRDPATQADFIVQELKGPEARVAAALNAARTPDEAGKAAISFFRPAGWTAANPMGGHNAPARVDAAVRLAQAMSGQPASAADMPAQGAQAAQGFAPPQPQQNRAPDNAARIAQAMRVMDNPMASASQRSLAQAFITRQMAQEQRDPNEARLKQLQVQQAEAAMADRPLTRRQQELAIAKAEKELKGNPNIEIIRDAATGEIIAVDKNNIDGGVRRLREGGPSKDAPVTRTIKQPDGSEVAVQWNPQSRTWDPLTAPAGGNAVRAPSKLTEQQSKDLVYYNRGIQALETMGDGSALTGPQGLVGATVGQIPVLGNYAKTDEYQMAEQSGRNFLNSILRKDTGAAITNQEMEIYGSVFLPRPGDSAELVRQKAEARRQALDAIRDGLGPAEVLALGQRLGRRQDARVPTPDRPGNVPPAQGQTPAQTQQQPAPGGFRIISVD